MRSSDVPHIEQVAYYKMDSMSNFELLLEIKDDDIENEHAFQQSSNNEHEHDATSCEEWAHGKENPPFMTFHPNQMQPNNPPYIGFNNHNGCQNM